MRAALNNGLTQDEIKEVLIQASVYAGVPSANHAFREASAVFAEMEDESVPSIVWRFRNSPRLMEGEYRIIIGDIRKD